MALYQYEGRDSSGKMVKGELNADSEKQVVDALFRNGVTPLNIQAATSNTVANGSKAKNKGPSIGLLQRLNAPSTEEMILFCRQMRSLHRAGVPIISALQQLAATAKNKVFKQVLESVSEDIESGKSLSVALSKYPHIFSTLFVNIIQAGASSGKLEEAFTQLSSYLTLENETKKKLSEATRYPIFVICALIGAIIIINIFVIPAFADIFSRFKQELPIQTRILMATSKFFIAYWPFLLVATILSITGFFTWIKTPRGKYLWHRIQLSMPIVGKMYYHIAMSRYSRFLAMMLNAGITMFDSMKLAADAMGNEYMRQKIMDIREEINQGQNFAQAAQKSKIFDPIVLQMIHVGEQTGSIAEMLLEVAEYYEEVVEYDLSKVSASIEPILIIGMAGIVLILALAVFLPLWEMTSAVKGGA